MLAILRDDSIELCHTAPPLTRSDDVVPWLVIGFLIALNAFFVAAEFALVAVPRRRIAPLARSGNSRAQLLMTILDDGHAKDRAVAACQVGITLSSLVAGAVGQGTLGLQLATLLQTHGLSLATATTASVVVVLVGLTVAQVVLGELMPKSLALQFPEQMALWVILPLQLSTTLFRPIIFVLNGTALLMLRPFGVAPGDHDHVHTRGEIELLFNESRRAGALAPEVHRQLNQGLSLSQRTARQIMVPRGDMLAVDVDTPQDALLMIILESPYSRLPVYEGSLDKILGTVSAKDVTALYARQMPLPPIRQLLRPIPFVPALLPADRVIRFLQEQRSSKAIVIDEFGGVSGIISVEDVLGELFGNIADELKDDDDDDVEVMADGRIKVAGSMTLLDIEPHLGVRWTSEAVTVGGHLTGLLGRLPAAGERFVIDGVEVTILERTPSMIRSLALKPKPSEVMS